MEVKFAVFVTSWRRWRQRHEYRRGSDKEHKDVYREAWHMEKEAGARVQVQSTVQMQDADGATEVLVRRLRRASSVLSGSPVDRQRQLRHFRRWTCAILDGVVSPGRCGWSIWALVARR